MSDKEFFAQYADEDAATEHSEDGLLVERVVSLLHRGKKPSPSLIADCLLIKSSDSIPEEILNYAASLLKGERKRGKYINSPFPPEDAVVVFAKAEFEALRQQGANSGQALRAMSEKILSSEKLKDNGKVDINNSAETIFDEDEVDRVVERLKYWIYKKK